MYVQGACVHKGVISMTGNGAGDVNCECGRHGCVLSVS
jgi:hypothetical protein